MDREELGVRMNGKFISLFAVKWKSMRRCPSSRTRERERRSENVSSFWWCVSVYQCNWMVISVCMFVFTLRPSRSEIHNLWVHSACDSGRIGSQCFHFISFIYACFGFRGVVVCLFAGGGVSITPSHSVNVHRVPIVLIQ